MGKGSPRLLRQLVWRTAVGALAALALTPSAFADGSIIGVSATVGPATVTASVAPASVEVSTSVATPALPLVTPVATPPVKTASAAPNRAAAITVSSDGGAALQATVSASAASIAPTPNTSQTHSASRQATTVAKRAEPARPVSRPHVSPERGRPAVRPQAAVPPRSLPSSALHARTPEIGEPAARIGKLAPRTSARGLEMPQLPVPELPLAPGSATLGGVGSGIGIALLLFVLAAELALTGLPRLGRRVVPLFPAARPHPYVLQLERPD
jgi:hypothetical protein